MGGAHDHRRKSVPPLPRCDAVGASDLGGPPRASARGSATQCAIDLLQTSFSSGLSRRGHGLRPTPPETAAEKGPTNR